MAATIWLEDFRSNHLWVKQVMVGKSIHPLDSCGDTFTVMETYYIYIYVACLSHIGSCFTLECSKYVQFFHTYLQAGLLHTLQQGSCLWLPFNREGYSACKEHLGKAATSGLLVAHGQCEQCSSQDSFLAYWIHRVPMSVPCRCVLQILGVCRCSCNPYDVVWHEA